MDAQPTDEFGRDRDGAGLVVGAVLEAALLAGGAVSSGGASISLRRLWAPPEAVPVAVGHGGDDARMLTALYGAADAGDAVPPGSSPGSTSAEPGDAARQGASERDGALALVVGAAANECFLTGRPVLTADLVPGLADWPGN